MVHHFFLLKINSKFVAKFYGRVIFLRNTPPVLFNFQIDFIYCLLLKKIQNLRKLLNSLIVSWNVEHIQHIKTILKLNENHFQIDDIKGHKDDLDMDYLDQKVNNLFFPNFQGSSQTVPFIFASKRFIIIIFLLFMHR